RVGALRRQRREQDRGRRARRDRARETPYPPSAVPGRRPLDELGLKSNGIGARHHVDVRVIRLKIGAENSDLMLSRLETYDRRGLRQRLTAASIEDELALRVRHDREIAHAIDRPTEERRGRETHYLWKVR